MTLQPDSPNSERDASKGESEAMPGLDESMNLARSRLKSGGPEIEEELLIGFVTNSLSDAIREDVRQRIETWSNWHDEYCRIRAYQALDDSAE